jgi:hypothetical protein
MKLNEKIEKFNNSLGYEKITKLKPYGKSYGFLNRQGIIEKTISRYKLEIYLKDFI